MMASQGGQPKNEKQPLEPTMLWGDGSKVRKAILGFRSLPEQVENFYNARETAYSMHRYGSKVGSLNRFPGRLGRAILIVMYSCVGLTIPII